MLTRGRLLLVCALMLVAPWTHVHAEEQTTDLFCPLIPNLEANGERANASVAWQVGLGPRLPGSNASASLLDGLETRHPAWSFTRDAHPYASTGLVNLVAIYPPDATLAEDRALGFGAHYDTRHVADREPEVANQSTPIPGANDGASGVAAVEELMHLIPSMNLDHAVVVVMFDAEDQGETPIIEGSRRWADNLSESERENLAGFVLLDMVGDASLDLANITSNHPLLNDVVQPMAQAMGLIEGQTGCDGTVNRDVYQPETRTWIGDDHMRINAVEVPAMVIIDHRYGPNATRLDDGYWHTLEDTPDKVSAESLETVARLVELGLRSGAWMDAVTIDEVPVNEPSPDDTEGVEEQARAFAGPLGLLLLGWAFVVGVTGLSVVSIVLLRKLRPPPAAATWSWDEA
ncbi:MAG TPA: M28 family peptidase [Candidatus Poseidoniales archaeon]|nr:MAG TPA: M28 family peptidase [Candidatus Poseidoniales archaeon]HII19364.1 M28 family peptidase [Candidatus Poseidoniaceae archaeon]